MPDEKPDDLAAELVPDPTSLPDVVVMTGHLGKSAQAGVTRLYVDLSFSEFVEIADDDVLARRSLESSEDPLAGSVLWVKRSASLLRAVSSSAQEHEAFLKGGITAKSLPQNLVELAQRQALAGFGVLRGGPTDHLYYSTCRGPQCEDPVRPTVGCCPLNTVR